MKKLFLLPFFILLSVVAFGQATITTIYATGIAGSFKTGYATATTRTSGDLMSTVTTTAKRGYGVFDLTGIPAGTVIDSCVIGFNVSAYSGSGTPSGWTTYGYAGDLSTVTSGATLYTDCASGTSISTATYGTATGNKTLPTTAAAQSFITANAGTLVSVCWTGGASRQYTITGLAGTSATTGAHQPYMVVKYCTGVTSVTATAAPNPVCVGNTLTLTGAGAGISSYSWAGPGSFTSAVESPTLTVTAASAGVYTFTAYNAGGCATSVTTTVSVNSTAGTVSGGAHLCPGTTGTVVSTSAGGTWSIAPVSVATISSTGVITGITAGAATVSYGCGTSTGYAVTVHPAPSAVFGPDSVCAGGTATLTDTSAGGTWSVTPTSTATINASGVVTGITAGTAVVTYAYTATTCAATDTITVLAAPAPITGVANECVGQTTTLADASPGGTWSSVTPAIASVDASGVVTGLVATTVVIKYTTGCGSASITNTVKALPGPIVGHDTVCVNSTTLLSNDIDGGTWSSGTTALASVAVDTLGLITGVATGDPTITYTLPTGCTTSIILHVGAIPDSILPTHLACLNTVLALSDVTGGGIFTTNDSSVSTLTPDGFFTGTTVDTVTVFYTLPTGCYISSNITINPAPAPITGNTPICAGFTDTLSDDSTGGVWSSANTAIATVSNMGVVTSIASTGGTINIIYTNTVTSCAVTTLQVIHPLPIPVITFIPSLATFTTQAGYVSYQWLFGFTPTTLDSIPGAVSHNLAALYDEYYTVIVIDVNGCTDTAALYNMQHLGVTNVTGGESITIYPNPVSSALYINAPAMNVRAMINDAAGKLLLDQPQARQINVSQLANGVYFLSLYNDDGQCVKVERFVKE